MSLSKIASLAAVVLCVACGPSVKPAMQAATDRQLQSYKGGQQVSGPASYDPTPWAVGQWAAYKVLQKDKPPAVQVIKVVGREMGGFWVETEMQDYYGRSVSKALYASMPRTAEGAIDTLMKVVTKKDDEAEQVMDFTVPNPMNGLIKATMKHLASGIVAPTDVSAAPKESVTVPAGTFAGTAKFQGAFSFGPVSKQVTGWFHPAVPLNGGVRTVTNDGEITLELIGYGMSGAQSAL